MQWTFLILKKQFLRMERNRPKITLITFLHSSLCWKNFHWCSKGWRFIELERRPHFLYNFSERMLPFRCNENSFVCVLFTEFLCFVPFLSLRMCGESDETRSTLFLCEFSFKCCVNCWNRSGNSGDIRVWIFNRMCLDHG